MIKLDNILIYFRFMSIILLPVFMLTSECVCKFRFRYKIVQKKNNFRGEFQFFPSELMRFTFKPRWENDMLCVVYLNIQTFFTFFKFSHKYHSRLSETRLTFKNTGYFTWFSLWLQKKKDLLHKICSSEGTFWVFEMRLCVLRDKAARKYF